MFEHSPLIVFVLTVYCLQERERLLKEVQHKFEELKKEQKKRDYLASKIRAMESKLLSGGAVRISTDQRDQRKKDIQQKRQEMIELKVIEMVNRSNVVNKGVELVYRTECTLL